MFSKAFLIAMAIAYVEARFGQENLPSQAISAVQGGNPGAAATVAGATISDLLGGANSCAKLQRADQIVADLGGGADAIAAAQGLVAAEKNTNPFAGGNAQNVCGDPSLPATAELRGITPLIDPAVDVNGAAAALSKQSLSAPLNADGMSIFDLMSANGLGDLVVSQAAGAAAGGAAAGGNNNANNNQNQNQNQNQGNAGNNSTQAAAGNNNNQAAAGNNNNQAAAGNNNNQAASGNNGNQQAASGNNNNNNNQAAAGNNNQQATAGNNNNNTNNQQAATGNNGNQAAAGGAAAGGAAAGGAADFGKCTPTIDLQAGRAGRKATEMTFQITDPLARGGQSDALNPNIITNALCNQLTNVCGANAAAVAKCQDAKAQVQAAGTKDQSTADLFNSAIGFAGGAKAKRSAIAFRA